MHEDSLVVAGKLGRVLQAAVEGETISQAAVEELLLADCVVRSLGGRIEGKEAGSTALCAIAQEARGAGMRCLPPSCDTGHVVLEIASPPESWQRGYVLTIVARDGGIAELSQQRSAPRPVQASALELPRQLREKINAALRERHPMLLSYVDADGQPHLSFRGSLQAHGDARLSLWVRNARGGFARAIEVNPRVALMYRDEGIKATYHFLGRAHVTASALERQIVYDAAPQVEREHDFAMSGIAVVIDLDRVEGYGGLGPSGQVDRVLLVRGA
ncbi:pyridoxamine 5'-phosphate oxidase family protein [Variovorax saccharolyticus]|uniref:pyridoxamine 5'-phosphate oxidase family protein n=1 Tax=Variovorax saccharolyticus TaxID=3053516 RepID=UPI0025759B45|nr:pyridoxamine 5'-phosphate oxidase family protein [Variovorax sp. J22R187]MDM0021894.1 pyridoxamine 5'-phosphate oxidase family protein [Variovorax sp. J22R187]